MTSCSWSPVAAAVVLRGDKISGIGGEKKQERPPSAVCFPQLVLGRGFGKSYPSLRMEPSLQRLGAARATLIADPATAASGGMANIALNPFRDTFYGLFDVKKEEEERQLDPVTPEKLDAWLRGSIDEIVRNIGEAPCLVQMFSCGEGACATRVERATPECWSRIRGRWGRESGTPDGIVLVEELKGEEGGEAGEDGRRTWGLMVQGRGMDSAAAACYILNTCRVRSSVGFCTHFCLLRAQCFGETAEVQFRKAWLQEKR